MHPAPNSEGCLIKHLQMRGGERAHVGFTRYAPLKRWLVEGAGDAAQVFPPPAVRPHPERGA